MKVEESLHIYFEKYAQKYYAYQVNAQLNEQKYIVFRDIGP